MRLLAPNHQLDKLLSLFNNDDDRIIKINRYDLAFLKGYLSGDILDTFTNNHTKTKLSKILDQLNEELI